MFWSAEIPAIALIHNFVLLQAILQFLKCFVEAKFPINGHKQLLEYQRMVGIAKLLVYCFYETETDG